MRHWTLLLREILSIALSLVSLCETHGEEIDKVVVGGPFEPTVASLSQYECPEWFRDAKFGIYAHWGVYSVAEQGE